MPLSGIQTHDPSVQAGEDILCLVTGSNTIYPHENLDICIKWVWFISHGSFLKNWNWDSSIGLEDRGDGVRFLVGARDFSLLNSGAHPA
jgi:hypothetical protein